jgi:hypothetical protein
MSPNSVILFEDWSLTVPPKSPKLHPIAGNKEKAKVKSDDHTVGAITSVTQIRPTQTLTMKFSSNWRGFNTS